MKTLFIIDIDGTLAHAGRRFEAAGPEPVRDNKEVYDQWVRMVQNEESLLSDEPVKGMRNLVQALECSRDCVPIYLTSREEIWRQTTRSWLDHYTYPYLDLIMRQTGNYAEGVDFKETTIDTLLQEYNTHDVVVIDDDGKGDIELMCKRRGWIFLKARSGGQL